MGLSQLKYTGQVIAIQSARMEIFMTKNIDGFPSRKVEDYGITPCDVIFNHTEKPKDYLYCRSINVFDNRWRVNIYSKRDVEGIEGKYISKSFFTHFNSATGELKIVS
jgi:hypothetical protein